MDVGVNWDAIGAMAEVLGAVAVVGSLLYLGRQIHASERMTRIEMRYRHMSDWRDRQRLATDDPDKSLLVGKISQSLSDNEFDEREIQIWRHNVFGYFLGLQTVFDLYKDGILTDEDFEYMVRRSLRDSLSGQPRLPLSWSRTKHILKEDFQAFVDLEIDNWERENT